ncbi:hypothetical protein [Vibrio diazotrophicus]|uniref:hypothetical protein n=1 Tax=Vibrio diazotrophicus TaxID=685 RepID=UPI003D2F62CE
MSNYYEQLSALQRMLDFDNASANTLSVMSLGGLSAKVRNLAYFGAFRSVISGLSDHPFRFKPITDSAIIRSLLA